ncbi:MAG: sulfurtransferase TusA family protein [Pseudomonadales bacterium]
MADIDSLEDSSHPSGSQEVQVLDVTGLNCPMPLLKAKKALNSLPAAALLKVIATDPGSRRDFETFSRQSGHELLEFRRDAEKFIYLLRKKS